MWTNQMFFTSPCKRFGNLAAVLPLSKCVHVHKYYLYISIIDIDMAIFAQCRNCPGLLWCWVSLLKFTSYFPWQMKPQWKRKPTNSLPESDKVLWGARSTRSMGTSSCRRSCGSPPSASTAKSSSGEDADGGRVPAVRTLSAWAA